MTAAASFKITEGVFALSVVNTAAIGYADDWQTPTGVDIEDATVTLYADADASWSCQIQSLSIDSSADTTTETVDATWCEPAQTIPNPGQSTYAINGTLVGDIHTAESLQAFLYLHDTDEAYFLMGLAGEGAPPAAAGRCRVVASSFGGAGGATLTVTIGALPVSRRYDLWYGPTPGTVIEGLTNTSRPGVVTVTAAAAGSPPADDVDAAA
jgi:hypothetical protein